MAIGETLGRHGSHITVAAAIAGQGIVTLLRGPDPVFALYAALIAGSVWAWHGRATQRASVIDGSMVQALTWDIHVKRRPAPSESELYREMTARMELTGRHVRASIGSHGLERVTMATSSELGGYSDARSTRYRARGHLWLGMRWFSPKHTCHLPAVLEHELAHLARRDTGKRVVVETAAVTATALAAGLLPTGSFALAALSAWLLTTLYHWWVEVACDLRAVRACGRQAVAELWRADLVLDRSRPLAFRIWGTLRALRTHPPLRLRVFCAVHTPLPASLAPTAHPLRAPAAG
ncbi:M48 family metalloprotease (plasmid) [Streptomyces sp. NBC_01456]|uniref:M48 family metalloprotease n=1 Tax=unclassified Streptomyces TaxID=2593676 RepID=UPI002E37DCEE|nr:MULTISPECIES: M48 family metalloprotease [unclassified Streptomyces]